MPKLTNTGSKTFEKVESGVEVYLNPHKNKRGGTAYIKEKGEAVIFEMGGTYMWLGHINRYEGQSEDTGENVYSTYFERVGDHAQVWTRKGENSAKIYEGRANDEALKEKVKFRGGKYVCTVLCVSEKGSLCFLKVDGMNLGQYFDFVKENGEDEFFKLGEQAQADNPRKKDEKLYLLDFQKSAGFVLSDETKKEVDRKIENLTLYLDHVLRYARTGSHEGKTIDAKEAGKKDVPAEAATADDDLPF